MRKCRKCNKTIFDDRDLKVIKTPEIIHTAKLVCPYCEAFVNWQSKDEYSFYKALEELKTNE